MQIITPNADLHYGTYVLRIKSALVGPTDSPQECTCVLSQSFMPRPRLSLVATPSGDNTNALISSIFVDTEEQLHLLMLPDGTEIALINDMASRDAEGFSPAQEPLQILPPSDRIKNTSFSFLNWPIFHRRGDAYLPDGTTLSLSADGWSIGIRPAADAKKRLELLRDAGGYITTHIGTLARSDGSTFTTDDVRRLTCVLHFFFAFSLGARTGPCFMLGEDSNGLPRYLEVGLGQVTPDIVSMHSSWVDSHHPEQMEELFPLFLQTMARDPLRKAIKDTLYWYLSANRLGGGVHVDSALVFILTGLELLAWTTLVLDRKVLSKNQFKKRSASHIVRQLMTHFGIPTEIPISLPSLISQAKRVGGEADLPHVLVSMRNDLVHPETKHETVDGAFYEAWRAGQWAIEAVLLAVMEYRGTYGNRTRRRSVGEVEPVPWVELA